MKKIKLFMLCFLLAAPTINAQQISTDTSASLSNLVESLLGTDCVEISNVNSPHNGSVNGIISIGRFNQSSSNFPFTNGIILSSGSVASSGNTEIVAPLSDGTSSWGTDSDLETTLGISNTLNATTLEFEFVSAANTVQFNYILASEEYQQEYPCFYSDGFAILLKPADTSIPFQNIAKIPGTSDDVNTFNIHDTIEGFCDASYEEFFEGYNQGDTNYNGRTTILSATASITPNVPYIIKFIIADDANPAFDSAVFIQGNSFNATVDLGPDIDTCASEIILNGDIGNTLSTYQWFLNGNMIGNETNSTLTATESGEYTVVVNSPLGGGSCVIEDSIIVAIEQEQSVNSISDFTVCDDASNDGVENFDLNEKITELIDAVNPANYTIQFFESASDAQNNINPLDTSFQNTNSPQTIFVRMEDTDNGCLAYPEFNLIVHPLPNSLNFPPYLICQSQTTDDFTSVDLSAFNNDFTESNTDILVSYHQTPSDATNGLNPLPLAYNNPNISEMLYVRLENAYTGCFNTTTLELSFFPSLDIPNQGAFIDLCLDQTEQFGLFDLNTVIPELLGGLSGISTSFYESFADAQQGTNPIPNPSNFQNTIPNFQIVYIRFEDDLTLCPTIATLDLHINLIDNVFPDEFISDLCDDASNDNLAYFDLQNVKQEVTQGLLNLSIELYDSLDDLNNQINPLDDTVLYEVTDGEDIIYAEIQSATCSTTIEVTLLINEATIASTVDINYCDDSINDGITEIILSELDDETLQGISPGVVRYFLTEEDALNDTNQISGTITNINNPQRFYVRIINTQTECSALTHVDVTIIEGPTLTAPSPLTSCDLNGDGIDIVDLYSKADEISSTFNALNFEFYETFENAEEGVSEISNSSNYETGTTVIFVKVIDPNTLCYDIVQLDVYVNTIPVISEVTPFISCENAGTGVADFILSDKDIEILNGQTDKSVRYFINETDAISATNEIDNSVAYQNSSNPEPIFYRIENTSDPSCFGVGSVLLEVRPAPIYTAPFDIFICDNESSNNQATIDLNQTISDITNESPNDLSVTFHPSMNDAEANTNSHPLIFTNSVNPEPIFTRIENEQGCIAIESFELNIVALPLINPAPDLTACDSNYDGQVSWDLTQVETEVLNIRQDNISIAYFSSIDDLELNTNPISDPTNYTNTTIQEIVYIKVTNTISNCYSFEPINIVVNLPPTLETFITYEICAELSGTVDLLNINPLIYSGNPAEVTMAYFSSIGDAQNNYNQISTEYAYNNINETLYVRVSYINTNCFVIYPFELRINPAPIPNSILDMTTCDTDFDGIASFNFTNQTSELLDGLDPAMHTVTYYSSENNAEFGVNPLPTTFLAYDGQIIYARLQVNRTGCFSILSFKMLVYDKPNVNISSQTLCLDFGPTVVDAETGTIGETYLWSTGETTPSISVNEIGEYSVTVTSPFGCTTTSNFEVIPSESAFIDLIETVDFSDPNNIIVTVSGSGDYWFSLDDGPLQESGIFENTSLGFHTIRVIDANGCAEVIRTVIVVDAPKFFTPNNDGVNDAWHIIGIETIPGTTITIFDRYGKLMTQLSASTNGWDGTYNGNHMPASDYWFTANVVKNNERYTINGHFTLRR